MIMNRDIEDLFKNLTIKDLEKYNLDKPRNEKQHYVPRVYLKWFSVNEKVIIYDLDKNSFLNDWKYSSINNICKYLNL